MRARVLAILAAAAAVAAFLPMLLGAPPDWLRAAALFLGAWTLVSVAATALLVVWFRAIARAQEALPQPVRRAEWKDQLAAR